MDGKWCAEIANLSKEDSSSELDDLLLQEMERNELVFVISAAPT